MAERTASLERPDRRRFLRHAVGAHRTVTLSCTQLYIRFVDAIGIGRVELFEDSVRREVGSVVEVVLTERDWLARDDFRRALERALRPTVPAPTSRRAGGRRTP